MVYLFFKREEKEGQGMSVLEILEKIAGEGKQPGGTPQYQIAGLGNPGEKYRNTRHNAGFLCLAYLAQRYHIPVNKLKFSALTGRGAIAGQPVLLAMPQTFMNLSGDAVAKLAAYYKIPAERVLILYDDIMLDIGRLRIRRKGSDGGHNGIKDIIGKLGTDVFPRIKIGIRGAAYRPSDNRVAYVLDEFSRSEREALDGAIERAEKAVACILGESIDQAMNRYNG